jgi:hypothetical protein
MTAPDVDAIRSEFEQYLKDTYYVPPMQPGDLTRDDIGRLLGMDGRSAVLKLRGDIDSGKILELKVKGENNATLTVYRWNKV